MIEPMTKERREAYVEVLEVLNNMDSKYIEKIPKKLIEFFINNRSKEYKFHLKENTPLEEQHLKEITINVLAMLNLNYWCESEEHKNNLLKKYYDNEIKYQKKLKEKYNMDNLFKKETKVVNATQKEHLDKLPENYEEPKWYVLAYENVCEFVSKWIRRLFN